MDFWCGHGSRTSDLARGINACRRPPNIAHCSRIADSWRCCKRSWHFWYPDLSFGMLGGCTLAFWPWDDLETLGSTTKDTLRSRLGLFQFLVDLVTPFWNLFGYLGLKKVCLFMLVSRFLFLMIFGSEFNLDVWHLKNKHFASEALQKSSFAEVVFLSIPGSVFHDFECPWDQFSWLLLSWRLARNLMTFQCDSGDIPNPKHPAGWG